MIQLTKEEQFHLLKVELRDAELDLAVIEEELFYIYEEIIDRELDYDELLLQYHKTIERKLQLEEELKRVAI